MYSWLFKLTLHLPRKGMETYFCQLFSYIVNVSVLTLHLPRKGMETLELVATFPAPNTILLTLHLPRKGMETFNEAIACCNLIIYYPQKNRNTKIANANAIAL